MPRVMITIRDEDYRGCRLILPSDKGVAALLNALRGAVSVDDDNTHESPPRITLGSEATVSVKTLPAKTRYCVRDGDVTVEVSDPVDRAPKRKALVGSPRRSLLGQGTLALEDQR